MKFIYSLWTLCSFYSVSLGFLQSAEALAWTPNQAPYFQSYFDECPQTFSIPSENLSLKTEKKDDKLLLKKDGEVVCAVPNASEKVTVHVRSFVGIAKLANAVLDFNIKRGFKVIPQDRP